MTDDKLKALVASLAVANKNLHEAYYLKLDCSKAKARLNWVPKWRLEMALDKIIGWQKQYQQGADMREVTLEQIGHYTKHGIESAAKDV